MKNNNEKEWEAFRVLCDEILVPKIAAALELRLDYVDEVLDAVARKLARMEGVLGTEGEEDIY